MKFFEFPKLAKSWSMWVYSTIAGLATVDFSTTFLDTVLPEPYKPLVYTGLAFLGMFVRAVKQPNLK